MRLIDSFAKRGIIIAALVAASVAAMPLAYAGQAASGRATRARAASARVPAPRDVVGFTPGDDRKLASWAQFVDYFKALDRSSDRVMLQELGKTTLGRPFLLAIISSPANLAKLDRLREIQRRLADPRTIASQAEAAQLIAEGRAIVLITCGIHSTEVGANLVSMNIAHKLAADDSPEVREILDKSVVLLVPSLNPDGIDIVKSWYDKTLGTPSEGTSPPELYHHYTGHDNNRDWYAFTQVETQMTVDKIHNAWHPQIVHDIHQQGETGTRFFIPPYVEPWEPNVPPLIQAGVNFMGTSMAWEMISEGKSGVVINGVYDAWTPARAYQHYHAGIRILSETASARLATPTNVPFKNQTTQVNVDPKLRSWNYPVVWQGGQWRLADIVDYQRSGAFALLRNAARYRERWISDFYKIGREAVAERKPGELFAVLIPPVGERGGSKAWREAGLFAIESILSRGGVEVRQATAKFSTAGAEYPAGTKIILMAQPYGAFAKTLLERQQYPDLREHTGGPPRRPYDVTAHTLPLLMGVDVVMIHEPFQAASTVSQAAKTGSAPLKLSRLGIYKSYAASMDEGWTRWVLDQYKVPHSAVLDRDVRAGGLRAKYDCIIIPDQSARQILDGQSRTRYPEEFAGGMGKQGVESLKKFIEEGGTVVTFNDASEFAIEQLDLPVKNVLAGVPDREFYCPGSILKIEIAAEDPLSRGVPALASSTNEAIAWFERGPAFETTSSDARVIARFADAKELLLSGWLLGAEKLAGRGAIVEVKRGKGRIIMFAFRPQYRGQSIATFPFIFNAITASGAEQ
jgi:hypothetical protein